MRAEAIYKSESCILILNIPYLQKVNKEKGLITYIILGIYIFIPIKLKTFSSVAVNFYFPATTIPSIINIGKFVAKHIN